MFEILVENHLRKRARIAKDASFKHDIYDRYSDAFGEDVDTVEKFIDKLAEAYDPTYNAGNQSTGSVYLEYIIDNLKRNNIQFNEQGQSEVRRLLQHYQEDQSSPKPLLQKDFQRYYRSIIPELQNALTEASAINKESVVNSPEFTLFYEKESAGVYGGQTQQQFYETLVGLFDPSDDQRYMAYVVRNLTSSKNAKGETIPPNITKEESPFIKSILTAHMQQVTKGNVKVKRDVGRFYPRIKFDLINALAPYVQKYNTSDNQSEAFEQTTKLFNKRIGEPVYTNDSHSFYYLTDTTAALKVIRNRQSTDFPEVSRHCTGYWCLPAMTQYFPAWISVDAYGFVDYAFVPKPQSDFIGGEIKNRFNSAKSSLTMTKEDYDSFVDFMLNCEHSEQLTKPFERIEGGSYTNAFSSDYGRFLLRAKDLETVNRLTKRNFGTVNEFIKWVFGVTVQAATNLPTFQTSIIPKYINFQTFFNSNEDDFPLFEQFRGKASGDTSGTALDYAELAKSQLDDWVQILQRFVNVFVKDKNASLLQPQRLAEFKKFFASADAVTIRQLFKTKYVKICEALARKVEDETLRFEGAASFTNINDFNNTLKYTRVSFGDALYNALNDAFAKYLSTGGLQTMTTDQITATNYIDLQNIAKLAGNNASDKAKINIVKIYMGMLQSATEASDRNYTRASNLITGITESLKATAQMFKMNEQDIAIAVAKAINNYIQQEQQQNKKVNEEIIMRMYKSFERNYESKIKAYNNVAPLFIQSVASIDAKSKAATLYPQLFAVQTGSYAPVMRLKIAEKFAALNSIQYRYSDDIKVSNSQDELVNANVGGLDRDAMYIKTSNWNALALFLRLATSDKRQRAEPSFSLDTFYRFKDTINNLIVKYKATLVDVRIKAFFNQPPNGASFINRYRDSYAKITNIKFIVRMKLHTDDVKDKIIAVTQEGKIVNALAGAGNAREEIYSNFEKRIQQMNAPANESKTLRFKKFNVLFERVRSFDKSKHECK